MFKWRTWSCPGSDALEMSTYYGCFPSSFFAEIRRSADASLRTKRPPHLFISGAPPHPVTTTVWRLRRVCAGRRRRCLLLGPQSQRDRRRSRWVLRVRSQRGQTRPPLVRTFDGLPEANRHRSLFISACILSLFAQTRRKASPSAFLGRPCRWGRWCFYTLNLPLCPPTDLFTNKVESLKLSVLNLCLQKEVTFLGFTCMWFVPYRKWAMMMAAVVAVTNIWEDLIECVTHTEVLYLRTVFWCFFCMLHGLLLVI